MTKLTGLEASFGSLMQEQLDKSLAQLQEQLQKQAVDLFAKPAVFVKSDVQPYVIKYVGSLPKLTENSDGSLSYGDIRITDSATVTMGSGTVTMYASPDLKRDECYVFQASAPADPLDAEHDGVKLRTLLACDANNRREAIGAGGRRFSPAQRAAVSAHWSAELRRKVAAAAEQDRNQVTLENDE